MSHQLDGARFRLVPFGPDGLPAGDALTLSDELRANCAATAELSRSVNYAPPWIGYLPAFRRHVVGGARSSERLATDGWRSPTSPGRIGGAEASQAALPPL